MIRCGRPLLCSRTSPSMTPIMASPLQSRQHFRSSMMTRRSTSPSSVCDSQPDSITEALSRRDDWRERDAFELHLDPHHDHQTGMFFVVGPSAGCRMVPSSMTTMVIERGMASGKHGRRGARMAGVPNSRFLTECCASANDQSTAGASTLTATSPGVLNLPRGVSRRGASMAGPPVSVISKVLRGSSPTQPRDLPLFARSHDIDPG